MRSMNVLALRADRKEAASTARELAALDKMTVGQFAEKYREVFGVPTRTRNRTTSASAWPGASRSWPRAGSRRARSSASSSSRPRRRCGGASRSRGTATAPHRWLR